MSRLLSKYPPTYTTTLRVATDTSPVTTIAIAKSQASYSSMESCLSQSCLSTFGRIKAQRFESQFLAKLIQASNCEDFVIRRQFKKRKYCRSNFLQALITIIVPSNFSVSWLSKILHHCLLRVKQYNYLSCRLSIPESVRVALQQI